MLKESTDNGPTEDYWAALLFSLLQLQLKWTAFAKRFSLLLVILQNKGIQDIHDSKGLLALIKVKSYLIVLLISKTCMNNVHTIAKETRTQAMVALVGKQTPRVLNVQTEWC